MNFRERRFMDKEGKGYIFSLFWDGLSMRFLFCLWPHLHRRSSFRLPAQRVGLQRHPFPLLHQTLDWYHGFLRSVWDSRCCQKIQERDSESLLHQAALLHLHSLYKCLFHKWQVSNLFPPASSWDCLERQKFAIQRFTVSISV